MRDEELIKCVWVWAHPAGHIEREYITAKSPQEAAELPSGVKAHNPGISLRVTVEREPNQHALFLFGSADPNAKVGYSIDPSGALTVYFADAMKYVFAPGRWLEITN